ncbi:MAG: hypothetical protein HY730_01710 [Candidatus Tectomicrobia bacterium]|uniref:Uncharacterized protein n=1 Tax=Tectimicrobiota bacterium TaxID=2528274 RepID=A0A933GK61_UNCTE|nr:hypothetical protein [Candidatus Tectomicrobia bacterium]
MGTLVSDFLRTTTSATYITLTMYSEIVAQPQVYEALGNIGIEATQTEAGNALIANTQLVSTLATVVTIALVVYSIARSSMTLFFNARKTIL